MGGMTVCGGVSRYVFFVSLSPFFHFAFGYLKDILILPNIVLLFLL